MHNRIEEKEIISRITSEEFLSACKKKISDKRRSTADGNKALRAAIIERPVGFLKVFQDCLDERIFAEIWKLQKQVQGQQTTRSTIIVSINWLIGHIRKSIKNNKMQSPYKFCRGKVCYFELSI